MTKPIKAIIADDSRGARNLLSMMLAEVAPDVEIVAQASNLNEAIQGILEFQPQAIFLDIEMPGRSGLDILDVLPENARQLEIIFITAYDTYAVRAFRLSAVDYLLKPVRENELADAIQKLKKRVNPGANTNKFDVLRKNLNEHGRKQIIIPTGGEYEILYLDEIEYLEADGSYVNLVMTNGRMRTCSRNLKSFESILTPETGFIRVHRKYLVRADKVARFTRAERASVTMSNGKVIDLARERKSLFYKMMGNLD